MAGYANKQGRKPLPTQLKVLRGNPGKRRLNDAEPKVVARIPSPPRELPQEAKREWWRIGRQLLAAGLVTDLDRMALAALVQSYSRWIEAQTMLAQTGLLIKGKDGSPRLNPLLRVSAQAQAEYTKMLSEFGLTPSSRSRVKATKNEEEDPFEQFLGKKAK